MEENSNIVAVRWYDNKAVNLLSTYVGLHPVDQARRWDSRKKEYTPVDRPAIIQEYNKFMGGIDLMDSFLAKYRFRTKSRRWYLYLFWHFLMIALINSWLVYRRDCELLQIPKKTVMKRRIFQAQVASALIESQLVKRRGRPSDVPVQMPPRKMGKALCPDVRKDGCGHWPVKLDK